MRPVTDAWVESLFDAPSREKMAPVLETEAIAVLLDGKWYLAGKFIWDCSDCVCLSCANNGKSCYDCKGFEHCMKHGGKIGNCPDFRTAEGKEQHCLENGCLCFTCQLLGEFCYECSGPIRCYKPRMQCGEYIGADASIGGNNDR